MFGQTNREGGEKYEDYDFAEVSPGGSAPGGEPPPNRWQLRRRLFRAADEARRRVSRMTLEQRLELDAKALRYLDEVGCRMMPEQRLRYERARAAFDEHRARRG